MKTFSTAVSLFALFICVNSLDAQQVLGNGNLLNRQRPIETFTKIKLNGCIDIVLELGDKKTIDVLADENIQEIITTDVSNNTLVISTKKNSSFNTKNKTEIHIYNSKLESVQINGSGDLSGKGKFSFADFEIEVNGSGDVDLDADASNLSLNTSGSGDIKLEGTFNKITASTNGSGDIGLKGSATSLTFSSTGSGDINTFGLKANDVSITSSGSGDAKVTAEKNLLVQTSGSGDVDYKGNPLSKSVSTKGSGECHSSN